jgi:hypothetical protein
MDEMVQPGLKYYSSQLRWLDTVTNQVIKAREKRTGRIEGLNRSAVTRILIDWCRRQWEEGTLTAEVLDAF